MKRMLASAGAASLLICHVSAAHSQAPGAATASPSLAERTPLPEGTPSEEPSNPPFIGNKGSRKVHRSDCIWGQKVSPGKRVVFSTYEEAAAAGYVPCRTCRPDLASGKGPGEPAVAQPSPPPGSKFCASSTAATFHRTSCEWARKISPEHIIYYRTREEAVSAGKKPCTICVP